MANFHNRIERRIGCDRACLQNEFIILALSLLIYFPQFDISFISGGGIVRVSALLE